MQGQQPGEKIWTTTGEKFEVSGDRVHVPDRMRSFFSSDDIFCLVASKGMGKTVCLKYKHYLVQQDINRPGLLIIPRSKEVDYVSLPRNLNHDWLSNLRTSGEWSDIWQIAIVLSLFLNHPDLSHLSAHHDWIRDIARFKSINKDLSRKLLARLETREIFRDTPSGVLTDLLSTQSVSNYLAFKDEIMPNLTRFYGDSFRSGACVFIDSFDQSLAEVEELGSNPEVWANGQIGLAKAAWQINRHNPHIKVFTSMRQEAYAQFADEDRFAMVSSMLNIRLDRDDLREIMNRHVEIYEKKRNLEAMTGLPSITNRTAHREEDIFDYIYRHILGKPRELAAMGYQIRQARIHKHNIKEEKEQRLRRMVNETAATEIRSSYLQGEMQRFLCDLKSVDNMDRFFRLIPHAILTEEEIKRITRRFARDIYGNPDTDCHPFNELFNIGLLGYITRDFTGNEVQRFTHPYEFEGTARKTLPASRYYFLHPSLHDHSGVRPEIKDCLNGILIGDHLAWTTDYDREIENKRIRLFISYNTRNRDFVDRFEEKLLDAFDDLSIRIYSWRDIWRMKAGFIIQDQMYEAVRDTDIMIAVLSRQAIDSAFMISEWKSMLHREMTERKGVRVLPVVKDDVDLSMFDWLEMRYVKRLPPAKSDNFNRVITSICRDAADMHEALLSTG